MINVYVKAVYWPKASRSRAMDVVKLIDEAVREQNVSEAEIARRIGMTPAGLNDAKNGRANLRPIYAVRLAELGGTRSADIIFDALAAFEKKSEDKAFWLGKAKALLRSGGVAAALAVGLIVNGLSTSKVQDEPDTGLRTRWSGVRISPSPPICRTTKADESASSAFFVFVARSQAASTARDRSATDARPVAFRAASGTGVPIRQ
jgi:hypothetical protein